MSAADLLAQSWAAHERSKDHRARHAHSSASSLGPVIAGSQSERMREWAEAYRLRKEAHAADPEHLDPAWSDEQKRTPFGSDTHAEMIKFYASKLGE